MKVINSIIIIENIKIFHHGHSLLCIALPLLLLLPPQLRRRSRSFSSQRPASSSSTRSVRVRVAINCNVSMKAQSSTARVQLESRFCFRKIFYTVFDRISYLPRSPLACSALHGGSLVLLSAAPSHACCLVIDYLYCIVVFLLVIALEKKINNKN